MKIPPSSLAAQYADLEDDELLRRVQSGQLTESAREVAVAELRQRGIGLQPISEEADAVPAAVGGDMCTLVSLHTPTEAHILVARLQAEGLHAIAADANLVQANPLIGIAVGGVRVLVAQEQLAQARALLEAMHGGELDVDGSGAGAKTQAPTCPRCGGARVAAKLAGIFRSLVLWNDAPRWRCADCRHTWPSST